MQPMFVLSRNGLRLLVAIPSQAERELVVKTENGRGDSHAVITSLENGPKQQQSQRPLGRMLRAARTMALDDAGGSSSIAGSGGSNCYFSPVACYFMDQRRRR